MCLRWLVLVVLILGCMHALGQWCTVQALYDIEDAPRRPRPISKQWFRVLNPLEKPRFAAFLGGFGADVLGFPTG